MKILIATGIYPPTVGGPATYSKLLFEELPKYGVRSEVLTFDDVRHLPKGIRHLVYAWRVIKKSKGKDFIYVQDPVSVGLPCVIAAFFARKKLALKIVGDYAWEQGVQRAGVKDNLDVFSRRREYPMFVRLLKWVQTFVANRARIIIVPSEYLKRIVTNWGVNHPHKIKVIYNAFEGLSLSLESHEKIRKQMEIEGTVITSVGRLVPWKGFRTLIDVVAEIKSEVPDVKLLIIGEGPDADMLGKYVEAKALAEHVLLTGRMQREELFRYIKASDVFVLNTEYEGFSHQLLEVMALGTPVVTTSVGGNPELIKNNESGLLVQYNDREALKVAIMSIVKMKDEGKRLAAQARRVVDTFTKDRMVSQLINELKKI